MSGSNSRSLRLAHKAEYNEVKDYLETNLPLSIPLLQALNARSSLDLGDIVCPKDIYISNGLNKFEFIFASGIVTSSTFQNFQVFWDIRSLKKEDVLRFLMSVPNFSWDLGFTMIGQNVDMAAVEAFTETYNVENILSNDLSALKARIDFVQRNEERSNYIIDELIKEKSLATKEFKITWDVSCRIYAIPREDEIREPKLPEGYHYGKLMSHHTPFVFKNWLYSGSESEEEYRILFGLLPSCAIYKNGDDDLQNPVSYVFMYPNGLMGQTYTDREHKSQGLAEAATLKLSIFVRKNFKLQAVIPSEVANKQSHDMHEKIGFKVQTIAIWKCYAAL